MSPRALTLPARVLWHAFFWTYERATWQYDVMVIAILAFVGVELYTDVAWFDSLGFASLLWTQLGAEWLLFIVAWVAVRAGWKAGATIAVGYAAWAAAVAVFFGVRRWTGSG